MTSNKAVSPDTESVGGSKPGSDEVNVVHKKHRPIWQNLSLAFASLGAVYGDIGTSPLYVMSGFSLPGKVPSKTDAYGCASLIFWFFVLLVFIKYTIIVLNFGPNAGEGGQVAIYAKIARSLHFGPKGVSIPGGFEPSDEEVLGRSNTLYSNADEPRNWKRNPKVVKCTSIITLGLGFLGCSLVFSDGLLTPTTTALTAVSGIQIAVPSFNAVVGVSEAILLFLFAIQFLGSTKLAFSFAPIMFTWLMCLGVSGIYNIAKWDPQVFRSFNPYYAIQLLKHGGIDNLSGSLLAITGTEAMFADVGHFGPVPIQIGITFTLICLMLGYLGQAAFLVKNPETVANLFYASIPGGINKPFYWVMFVLAILSTIVASQALILGVQSIVAQLINLDCWPRFKVIRFSKSHHGKVFIPAATILLCIGVVACTAAYQNSNNVTAAYGLSISLDFIVTTTMLTMCLIFVYEFNPFIVMWFPLIFLPLEWSIAIANFKKVPHGAWFPLMMCAIFMCFLVFWRYFRSLTVQKQIESRVRITTLFPDYRDLQGEDEDEVWSPARGDSDSPSSSMPQAAIIYSDLPNQNMLSPNTFPAIYSQLVQNFNGIPGVIVFCTLKTCGLPVVEPEDHVFVVPSKVAGHYKVVMRFGFTEAMSISDKMLASMWRQIAETRNLREFKVVHIFEKNSVRNRLYPKTRNVFRMATHLLRWFVVEFIYAPINAVYQNDDLVVPDSEVPGHKLFVGGITRI